MTTLTQQTSEATRITTHLLDQFFNGQAAQNVSIRLWDGTLWPDADPRPATLVLKHPGALRAMLLPGTELGLAEAYLYNDYDIEGSVEDVFDLAESLSGQKINLTKKLGAGKDLLRLPAGSREKQPATRRGPAKLKGKQHSIERDRQAVTYHYNVSNDFYALFLDRQMVYSCAYFTTVEDSLEAAQVYKLDMICRKLRLQPGQRILDIGCGWGGLAMHAARNYDVDVTGITLSQPQADLANRRIQEAGLAGHCRVEVCDYREVDSGPYDALVSVGMFEHVGKALLPTYFEKAYKLLRPGGVFLNHGIARRFGPPSSTATDASFLNTYVFPDGELLPINVTLQTAEEAKFEVRDVESLREHYAMTLRHWVRRLEEHHSRARQFVDEPTYRVWRLYLSASIYGFLTGRVNVYQSLLVKQTEKGESKLPLTRQDWYSPRPGVAE